MTSHIRVGRGVQDSPKKGTLQSRTRQVGRSEMAKKRGTSLMNVPLRKYFNPMWLTTPSISDLECVRKNSFGGKFQQKRGIELLLHPSQTLGSLAVLPSLARIIFHIWLCEHRVYIYDYDLSCGVFRRFEQNFIIKIFLQHRN